MEWALPCAGSFKKNAYKHNIFSVLLGLKTHQTKNQMNCRFKWRHLRSYEN
jgi:hypothetical protein